jgi:hypothetical protein
MVSYVLKISVYYDQIPIDTSSARDLPKPSSNEMSPTISWMEGHEYEYQIRLIKSKGLNRSFTTTLKGTNFPSWSTISTKIESLYKIPLENVGVLYIDKGDSMALSSEEELSEYYKFHPFQQHNQRPDAKVITFVVIDLRDYPEKVEEPKPTPNNPSEADILVISSDPLHVRLCDHQMWLLNEVGKISPRI